MLQYSKSQSKSLTIWMERYCMKEYSGWLGIVVLAILKIHLENTSWGNKELWLKKQMNLTDTKWQKIYSEEHIHIPLHTKSICWFIFTVVWFKHIKQTLSNFWIRKKARSKLHLTYSSKTCNSPSHIVSFGPFIVPSQVNMSSSLRGLACIPWKGKLRSTVILLRRRN